MTFGFLLTAGPEQQATVGGLLRLAQAALEQGHGVRLYVMDDGIAALRGHPKNPWAPAFRRLLEAGTPITACASNASARGIEMEALVPGVHLGGQYEHAAILKACDHFLAFT